LGHLTVDDFGLRFGLFAQALRPCRVNVDESALRLGLFALTGFAHVA